MKMIKARARQIPCIYLENKLKPQFNSILNSRKALLFLQLKAKHKIQVTNISIKIQQLKLRTLRI